jgi:hypothetical protein
VNVVTNRVVSLLGKDEAVRFLNVSLYQGAPAKKTITTLVRRKKSRDHAFSSYELPS